MRTRITAAAAVAALALLVSCSSDTGDGDKPDPPRRSASADPAAAREACVQAWADAFKKNPDVDLEDDEPAVCATAPGRKSSMYLEGVRKKLDDGRQRLEECGEDPSCTTEP